MKEQVAISHMINNYFHRNRQPHIPLIVSLLMTPTSSFRPPESSTTTTCLLITTSINPAQELHSWYKNKEDLLLREKLRSHETMQLTRSFKRPGHRQTLIISKRFTISRCKDLRVLSVDLRAILLTWESNKWAIIITTTTWLIRIRARWVKSSLTCWNMPTFKRREFSTSLK